MSSIRHLAAVRRLDGARSAIQNPQGVPCTLLARENVAVEAEAVEQLLQLLALQDTLDDLWRRERAGASAPFFGDAPGRIAQVVLTPDFHRGAGIPVGTVIDARGFVIPAAVGSDVCCGMRLLATDLRAEELVPVRARLEQRLRAIFFEGERDIPLSPRQREAILREGLPGLHATRIDTVETTPLGATAHEWGLARGRVVIMCHSGSVGLGHTVGASFREAARRLHPAGAPHPAHGFHVLPTRGPHAAEGQRHLAAMRAAANSCPARWEMRATCSQASATIQTLEEAGGAAPVARLRPLVTVKG